MSCTGSNDTGCDMVLRMLTRIEQSIGILVHGLSARRIPASILRIIILFVLSGTAESMGRQDTGIYGSVFRLCLAQAPSGGCESV
jgi:hypothetical protein